jgi:hypothetical protein
MVTEPIFRQGTTRSVVIHRDVAIKLARNDLGMRSNLFEASLYGSADPRRREMLCPVLWCSPDGVVLAMLAARPCSEADIADIRSRMESWGYAGPGDIEQPFEPNPRNWGMIDGRLVALDYSANVDGD